MRPRSSRTAQRIADALRPLRRRAVSRPRSPALEWDDDILALDHPHRPRRRDARQVRRPWAPARCTGRSCPASRASRRSPATASTPAAGTTTTPAATPTARRSTGSADKRVGIIGTGATVGAVHPAPRPRRAGELFVFQRTPSSIDIRNNHPIDPDWFATLEPGWQQRVADELHHAPDRRVRRRGPGEGRVDRHLAAHPRPGRRRDGQTAEFTPERFLRAFDDSDDEKMEEIRARVDEIVADPNDGRRAQALVPPAVQAAVLPRRVPRRRTTSPDVTSSTPTARASSGSTRPACGSAATTTSSTASSTPPGSRWARRSPAAPASTPVGRDGITPVGALGRRACDRCTASTSTASPTCSSSAPRQGANLISNVPHNLTESGSTIAAIVAHAEEIGAEEVEVTAEAENDWVEMLRRRRDDRSAPTRLHARLLQQRGRRDLPGGARPRATPTARWPTSTTSRPGATRATSKASTSAEPGSFRPTTTVRFRPETNRSFRPPPNEPLSCPVPKRTELRCR